MNLHEMEFPRWLYRGCRDEPEGKIFESPALVPPGEGWVETPAKLHLKPKDDTDGQRAENAPRESGREGIRQAGESERRSEGGSGISEAEIRLGAGAGPGFDRGGKLETVDQAPRGNGRDGIDFGNLSKEALLEVAAEANVPADKRWGIARIQKALRDAG